MPVTMTIQKGGIYHTCANTHRKQINATFAMILVGGFSLPTRNVGKLVEIVESKRRIWRFLEMINNM
jgi:hypothetical protein